MLGHITISELTVVVKISLNSDSGMIWISTFVFVFFFFEVLHVDKIPNR